MIDVLGFVKKNGFIWGPEPEIYGGVAGFHTYGPMGKLLKNNVESSIRSVFSENGFWEIEAPIVMPEIVWKASGHLDGFVDPMLSCRKCKANFRADKLIEEKHDVVADSFTKKQLLDFIKDKKIKCPNCKSDFEQKIIDYNLMMKTILELDKVAYNRPETATTTYLPFRNYYDFFRKKLPIQVFQIGKAFRNEISPRQNVVRGREFTQAEAQIFIFEKDKNNFEEFEEIKNDKLPIWDYKAQAKGKWSKISLNDAIKKKYVKNKAYAWCIWVVYEFYKRIGIPEDKMRLRQHSPEELAHYAEDAWDLEVNLNTYGWVEMVGVHDRKAYDLEQHEKFSGTKLKVEGEYPHVLEIAFGSDRPTFALIDLFLKEEKVDKETRVVLKLPKKMAPVKVAVFPLVNKDNLPERAEKIYDEVKKCFTSAVLDGSGSIGKRYRRMDEVGTPYCITVDHDTLKNNTVTVRDRDSMKQERVKIKELVKYLYDKIYS